MIKEIIAFYSALATGSMLLGMMIETGAHGRSTSGRDLGPFSWNDVFIHSGISFLVVALIFTTIFLIAYALRD